MEKRRKKLRAGIFIFLFVTGVKCRNEKRKEREKREGEREKSAVSERTRDEKLINYSDTWRGNWVNDKREADEGR